MYNVYPNVFFFHKVRANVKVKSEVGHVSQAGSENLFPPSVHK